MVKFRPEDLPTGPESRESHLEFIRINWPVAAAFAWQQYRKQGRGCIVIEVVFVFLRQEVCIYGE